MSKPGKLSAQDTHSEHLMWSQSHRRGDQASPATSPHHACHVKQSLRWPCTQRNSVQPKTVLSGSNTRLHHSFGSFTPAVLMSLAGEREAMVTTPPPRLAGPTDSSGVPPHEPRPKPPGGLYPGATRPGSPPSVGPATHVHTKVGRRGAPDGANARCSQHGLHGVLTVGQVTCRGYRGRPWAQGL